MNRRKVVVVGDGACGKTCAVMVFDSGNFMTTYVPTVFEQLVKNVRINNKNVQQEARGTPYILAGLKSDLRYDDAVIADLRKYNKAPVTYQMGQNAGRQIGAAKYVECSAKNNENIRELFEAAVLATERKSTRCDIV